MSENEMTMEELEKTTRETLQMLAKKLRALSERSDVCLLQVRYEEHRPIHPEYEKGVPEHFLGMRQVGPKTLCLDISDFANDGKLIS